MYQMSEFRFLVFYVVFISIFGFQFCIHSFIDADVRPSVVYDDDEDAFWEWTTIVRADIVVVVIVVVAGETRREGGGTIINDFDVHSFHVHGFVRR